MTHTFRHDLGRSHRMALRRGATFVGCTIVALFLVWPWTATRTVAAPSSPNPGVFSRIRQITAAPGKLEAPWLPRATLTYAVPR